MSKEPFYVTTPIYYVNGEPHIGTAYTTVATDATARFARMDGRDVFFLTGMDEHGEKVAEAAAAHGMTPQEWCDSQVTQFTELWRDLDITNDDFIRTTQPRHVKGVQDFMQKLHDNGYLYKGTYDGYYCTPCETQFTEGDLVDGKCPDCGREVKVIHEENWFFKLSEFGDKLLAYYDEHPNFIRPQIRENEIRSFIEGGMHDLSVSRTAFDWGIPLPFDPEHVTYVWVDALINYLTALGYGSDDTTLLPLRRQGHHPLSLRDLAGHAHGRWHGVPASRLRARLSDGRRWLQDEQVEGQRALSARPHRALRCGRLSLLLSE